MSKFSAFMRSNKIKKENVKFAVTRSLCDEHGIPLEWELRPLTSKENDRIRVACTKEIPNKNGTFRQKVDTTVLVTKLVCASVVFPDLNDKDLQDSYGVMCAEDLLYEMVDDAGEMNALIAKVQEISGYTTIAEDVEEAKN